MESLFEQLREYSKSAYYPYHMPGHKRNAAGGLSEEIARIDITEIDGFDNLHQPEGILREVQEQAAAIYGAEESFYLINGSTGGILSAISTVLPPGGHILMARNCHKSAYHAAYLRNLKISYLYPSVMEEFDICDVITPGQVREALERNPDVGAVFLVSPTYEGRIADIRAIARTVHEKRIPLIVDEAHGAHLGMAEGFAENSCQAGADIVIHSVHKTLPAMTQTALLHVNGNRIDREKLKRFLHIYQTSSPSYVLMASIDNAMGILRKGREELFAAFYMNYTRMLQNLSVCRNLQFLSLKEGRQDIGKLVISAGKFGLSGQKLYNLLLKEYHLQLEMASVSYCLAMFTVGDREEGYARMTGALLDVDGRITAGALQPDRNIQEKSAFSVTSFLKESQISSISLTKAWDQERKLVPLEKAAGSYAGEFINLYPPGIPLLVPGERFSPDHCRQIAAYLEQGLNVQGISFGGNDKNSRSCLVSILKEQ